MGEDYLVFLITQELDFQMKSAGCRLRIKKKKQTRGGTLHST